MRLKPVRRASGLVQRIKESWPAALGGSDAPEELLGDDPELGSAVLGRRPGQMNQQPMTGLIPTAARTADATQDGGPKLPAGAEPDLKDAVAAQVAEEKESSG